MAPRELGHDLRPLEQVQQVILSLLEPLGAEARPLAECYGAVLREEAVVTELIPPFDNSAMDGFAVQVADVASASEASPVTLRVSGQIAAGEPGGLVLEPRSAKRIMTGAPLPSGAEAVIPHEVTRFDDRNVTFTRPAKLGQNIRRAGGDLRPGDLVLKPGCVLHGPQLAILAALGRDPVRVTRKLRVAVVSSGNELVEVGSPCGPGQIRNSNAYSLMGLLLSAGVEPVNLGIVRDTKEEVLRVIRRAVDAGLDAIVSTGGVSAGEYDWVQVVVREHAEPGHVFKVAMRPGKPQVFGLFDGRPLFGLPGNPAASMISFEVFVRPALRRMRGEGVVLPERFGVRFPFDYPYKPGRVLLLRARVEPDEPGGYRVVRPGEQDSSFLSSLAEANAIVTLPSDRDVARAGEIHPAFWFAGR